MSSPPSRVPSSSPTKSPTSPANKSPTSPPKKNLSKSPSKGTQVHGKSKKKSMPCPRLCNLVPENVPRPGPAQAVLHPRKDVFVLKVAKVGPNGDRRCKMELELVTPKGPEKKVPSRIDTRETQCEPEPPPCCCVTPKTKKK